MSNTPHALNVNLCNCDILNTTHVKINLALIWLISFQYAISEFYSIRHTILMW